MKKIICNLILLFCASSLIAQNYDPTAKGSYVYVGINCPQQYQSILDNAGNYYRDITLESYPYTINIFPKYYYTALSQNEKEQLHIDGEIKVFIDSVKTFNKSKFQSPQWEAVAYYHWEVRDIYTHKFLYEGYETCTRAYYSTEEESIAEVLACVKRSCEGEGFKYSLSKVWGHIVTLDEVKGNEVTRVSVETIPPILAKISKEIGFKVYTKRGGRLQSIGNLVVEDYIAEDRIFCKVRKGGKDIFLAQEAGEVLFVKSYNLDDFPSLKNEFDKRKQVKSFSSLTNPKKNCNSVQRLLILPFTGSKEEYATAFQKSIAGQLTKSGRVRARILEKPLSSYSKTYRDSLCRQYDVFVNGVIVSINTESVSNSFYPYKATTKASLIFVDTQNGKAIERNPIVWTGSGQTQDQAVRSSFTPPFLSTGLNNLVYGLFPITAEIVTIDEVSGSKAKSVTISVGKDAGVYYDMPFYVFEHIGGDNWQKIGELKLKFSNQSNRAQCDVINGGKDIKVAIEEGRTVRIMSHPE